MSTKRALDFLGSFVLLSVLAPVIGLCMIAIRITSHGPAIFRQERIGKGGQTFVCLKLRTMFVGTDSVPTHEVSSSQVTPIGRILRRFKLDELPQLINVLYGEMSLVGPRPCLPQQAELIAARRELGVLTLRPGITGLAQVSGVDMSDPDKLAVIDQKYLKSQSAIGDLYLLLATLAGSGVGDPIGRPASTTRD